MTIQTLYFASLTLRSEKIKRHVWKIGERARGKRLNSQLLYLSEVSTSTFAYVIQNYNTTNSTYRYPRARCPEARGPCILVNDDRDITVIDPFLPEIKIACNARFTKSHADTTKHIHKIYYYHMLKRSFPWSSVMSRSIRNTMISTAHNYPGLGF